MAKWNPKNVEEVTGVPEAEMYKAAKKPLCRKIVQARSSGVYNKLQHTIGNNTTRASCILRSYALGNVGKEGRGQYLRGHDNVQGVTDSVPTRTRCLVTTASPKGHEAPYAGRKRLSLIIEVPLAEGMMGAKGTTVSRWVDAVLESKENVAQPNPVKGLFFLGPRPELPESWLDMKKPWTS